MVCCRCLKRNTKGLYYDENRNEICGVCIGRNQSKLRTKVICRECKQREVWNTNDEDLCCRCLKAHERKEGKRLCVICDKIIRHKFTFTNKCSGCYSPNDPKKFNARLQKERRELIKKKVDVMNLVM